MVAVVILILRVGCRSVGAPRRVGSRVAVRPESRPRPRRARRPPSSRRRPHGAPSWTRRLGRRVRVRFPVRVSSSRRGPSVARLAVARGPPRAALRLARALHGTPTLSFAAKLPTSGHASKDPSARASLGSLRSPADGRLDAAADARSLRAVDVAIKANTAICACKLAAYAVTGSSAMLAEAVHSVADILNQSLLQLGIRSSSKAPDASYNYGYRRERFVWSLISAVGVFFMGSGVTFVHGIHGLYHPVELEHIWVGLSVLGASAAIDAYSLHVAFGALRENADAKNMTLSEFVESGHDPTSVAVVAEDAAAVSGCVVAAAALAAAQYTGNPAFDAGGRWRWARSWAPPRRISSTLIGNCCWVDRWGRIR